MLFISLCVRVKLILLLAFILGRQMHLSNNANSRKNKTVTIPTAERRHRVLHIVTRDIATARAGKFPLQVFSHCRTEKAPRQQEQEFFTRPLGFSRPRPFFNVRVEISNGRKSPASLLVGGNLVEVSGARVYVPHKKTLKIFYGRCQRTDMTHSSRLHVSLPVSWRDGSHYCDSLTDSDNRALVRGRSRKLSNKNQSAVDSSKAARSFSGFTTSSPRLSLSLSLGHQRLLPPHH